MCAIVRYRWDTSFVSGPEVVLWDDVEAELRESSASLGRLAKMDAPPPYTYENSIMDVIAKVVLAYCYSHESPLKY